MRYFNLCFPGWPNRVKNMQLGEHRQILLALLPQKAGSEVKGEESSQVLENAIPPHQMAWSSSVFQNSLLWRNLLLPSERLHGRLQVWAGKWFPSAVVVAMQVTGGRKFLELPGVQRQTHEVYEPPVWKRTKSQNPALVRALREEPSSQRCLHRGINLEQDEDGLHSALLYTEAACELSAVWALAVFTGEAV